MGGATSCVPSCEVGLECGMDMWGPKVRRQCHETVNDLFISYGKPEGLVVPSLPAFSAADPMSADREPLTEELKRRQSIEASVAKLFRLQDLNANGVLEERELIKLNEMIAELHYGMGFDRKALKRKYSALFRERLDPAGNPVSFDTFCDYIYNLLEELDPDPRAQEMIVEHWVQEAELARSVFSYDLVSPSPSRRFTASKPMDIFSPVCTMAIPPFSPLRQESPLSASEILPCMPHASCSFAVKLTDRRCGHSISLEHDQGLAFLPEVA